MRFNQKYGDTFVIPEPFISPKSAKIMSLTDPEKKMSKSTPAENSKIMLDDEPFKASKKIMGATTDSFEDIQFDFKTRPGISNLLYIEALIADTPLSEVVSKWQGISRYGDLKKQVANSVSEMLVDFQNKMAGISDDDVLRLFKDGEKYANEKANAKLLEVQKAFNLR